MLIELTVRNFRSIKDEVKLSLLATASREHRTTHTTALPKAKDARVLKSAVIYGPNASGKTNVLTAAKAMRSVVLNSATSSRPGDPIPPIHPFRFDPASRKAPTMFEVLILKNGVRYQYGFEASRTEVVSEWLFAYPKGRAQHWFTRSLDSKSDNGSLEAGDNWKGQKQQIWEATRKNALLLSTAVQLNNDALYPVFEWFRDELDFVDGHAVEEDVTIGACESSDSKLEIIDLMRMADFGIRDLELDRREVEMPDVVRTLLVETDQLDTVTEKLSKRIRFRHTVEPDDDAMLELREESQGTQKYFALTGRILKTLNAGTTLVVDELGSSMHPLLVRAIVNLFHDPKNNPHAGQLIFNTHDTSLLDQVLFRRDQIWFTEKASDDSSQLIPLADFSPRKGTEPLELNYLRGRYGALPLLRLGHLFPEISNGEKETYNF